MNCRVCARYSCFHRYLLQPAAVRPVDLVTRGAVALLVADVGVGDSLHGEEGPVIVNPLPRAVHGDGIFALCRLPLRRFLPGACH